MREFNLDGDSSFFVRIDNRDSNGKHVLVEDSFTNDIASCMEVSILEEAAGNCPVGAVQAKTKATGMTNVAVQVTTDSSFFISIRLLQVVLFGPHLRADYGNSDCCVNKNTRFLP